MKDKNYIPPNFDYLVISEKVKLAKIYDLVKNTKNYTRVSIDIISLTDLVKLIPLLKGREFSQLKYFYIFLCENGKADLVLQNIKDRYNIKSCPYPMNRIRDHEYE